MQKNQIAHKLVLELCKTTRQALAEAEKKTVELNEAKQQMAELQSEVARLTGLVDLAEVDKQKALTEQKDRYLRELAKVEQTKKAEITELEKKIGDAEDRGYKEGETTYILQCEAAKDLFFKCRWKAAVKQLGHGPETEVFQNSPSHFIPSCMAEYAAAVQQKFLESEDEDEEIVPDNAPVVNDLAIHSGRVEPLVEDLTTELPTETELRVELDADLEDLFA
ncbi:uncharacterized protein LOC114278404 [Camellia sinensis]|uniref:uncharacterized protein LOC114278404 n=1 Tax=Camellia sinensis TaxID=4442 RepID=UPI001035DC40|nr:uncharacterized protein LOC114278404 [Camellia sinensis]XP_028076231.1 uncharacterized protein LOC114278404 [Camellia sinensis]XP_028076232.1 uncharacterized protein LOC114278404 [Camellia sinensis]XP_028076233.1 uncharacterized protein LOC114278404 [Camellia sinensis]XP_028076234.1 uncharacterized protein LOC114278404 [Camellia sinensis]XP_028076236.1 uncharacterized protein LOC114278404 [Camellia sinensis]XP_028076237.1 uncharacterized protein LOC114278404 [Camellia sinensis]XP_02807623